MKAYPAILAIYQELYAQATLRKNFKYTPTLRDRKLIFKFIAWLYQNYNKQQVNEELLISYFEFQFSRYSGVRTPKGKNNIMVNWLIGQKALQEWKQRVQGKRRFVRWQCSKDFTLNLKIAFKSRVKVNIVPFAECINIYEEQEKKRFYNTKNGYVYCAQFTTLYNPLSKWCSGCDFSESCQERLKINFEKLYLKRINNGLQNYQKSSTGI